jgi:predicted DCC family thiol-disulfide oxidoreductase YuxK
MNTVIFDGECNFCIDKVHWLQRHDPHHELEFIARQDPTTEQRFPALKSLSLEEGIVYIDSTGQFHIAADGIYRIAQHLDLPLMRLYSAMYPLPLFKQAAQLCYRVIAANRKRLGKSCAGGACKLPAEVKR